MFRLNGALDFYYYFSFLINARNIDWLIILLVEFYFLPTRGSFFFFFTNNFCKIININ